MYKPRTTGEKTRCYVWVESAAQAALRRIERDAIKSNIHPGASRRTALSYPVLGDARMTDFTLLGKQISRFQGHLSGQRNRRAKQLDRITKGNQGPAACGQWSNSSGAIRIAYVISSLEGGGAALPVPAITRVLREAGAQVAVFALTRRDGRALPAMLADGLEVRVREGGEHDNLSATHWLDRALTSYRPSHIWTSLTRATAIGLLLGWRRHIPVVSWQHNEYIKPSNMYLLQVLRRRAAVWVCDSDQVAAVTAERLCPEAERLFTWPLFAANPDAPRAQPWRQGEPLRLGSLGRLHRAKGYDVLTAALSLLGERGFQSPVPFEITIAGEGAERAAIDRAAKRAGFKSLYLPGYTEHPRDFLAQLHLYLQPTRGEGLCIAVHEAMQAGLPVIASAVGQIPHTLEQGRSGWLVPPADASALADALAAALADPAQLAAMGRHARKRVLAQYSAAAFRQSGEAILARLRRGDRPGWQRGSMAIQRTERPEFDSKYSGGHP